jgi:hypothetical protein
MSSEISSEVLQSVLQYYRAKCSQLEYDFLLHKLESEKKQSELESVLSKITNPPVQAKQ